MGYKTTIQIALIIISVVIALTYIKPQLTILQQTQDQTADYVEAIENAESYRAELSRLENNAAAIPSGKIAFLNTYLPETIDTIAVMRDIQNIVDGNNMALRTIDQTGEGSALTADEVVPAQGQEPAAAGDAQSVDAVSSEQITVEVTGTYDQFKALLADFERNQYPLEVVEISLTTGEGSLFNYTLTIETYALLANNESL